MGALCVPAVVHVHVGPVEGRAPEEEDDEADGERPDEEGARHTWRHGRREQGEGAVSVLVLLRGLVRVRVCFPV